MPSGEVYANEFIFAPWCYCVIGTFPRVQMWCQSERSGMTVRVRACSLKNVAQHIFHACWFRLRNKRRYGYNCICACLKNDLIWLCCLPSYWFYLCTTMLSVAKLNIYFLCCWHYLAARQVEAFAEAVRDTLPATCVVISIFTLTTVELSAIVKVHPKGGNCYTLLASLARAHTPSRLSCYSYSRINTIWQCLNDKGVPAPPWGQSQASWLAERKILPSHWLSYMYSVSWLSR